MTRSFYTGKPWVLNEIILHRIWFFYWKYKPKASNVSKQNPKKKEAKATVGSDDLWRIKNLLSLAFVRMDVLPVRIQILCVGIINFIAEDNCQFGLSYLTSIYCRDLPLCAVCSPCSPSTYLFIYFLNFYKSWFGYVSLWIQMLYVCIIKYLVMKSKLVDVSGSTLLLLKKG